MKKFRIKGANTPFPLDMLRFDECWPASVEDSQTMSNSFGFRHGRRVRWTLTLISNRQNVPTIDRWASFAVEVVDDTDVETFKEQKKRNKEEREARERGDVSIDNQKG